VGASDVVAVLLHNYNINKELNSEGGDALNLKPVYSLTDLQQPNQGRKITSKQSQFQSDLHSPIKIN